MGIDELLDYRVVSPEHVQSGPLTVELNTGRTKAYIENFDLPDTVTSQSVQGLREFKFVSSPNNHVGDRSCLYVLSKRYKQETAATLQGVFRYLSGNNAPMLAAFKKLREKKVLCLAEKVALETGFYSTFRQIVESSPSLSKDPVKRQNVFEYSRAILMSILELVTRVIPSTTTVQALEACEKYREADFVCPFSMRQIESPVELWLDDGTAKICEQKAVEELIKLGKEVPGVKDPKKLAPTVTSQLRIMKTAFYCLESPTLTYWLGSSYVQYSVSDSE